MAYRARPLTRRQIATACVVWSAIVLAVVGIVAAVAPFAHIAITGDYPGHAVIGLEEDHPAVAVALWLSRLH